METLIKRTNTKTSQATVLTFEIAVDQIIHDTCEAYPEEMEGDVEEWLSDMSTVFETTSQLEQGEVEVGDYKYTHLK